MRLLLSLLLMGLLSACRIAINTDEYEFLTREEKALIQPYPGLAEIGPKTDSKPRFYSVRTGEVQEMIRAHPYTLLYRPGCSPDKNPEILQRFVDIVPEAASMGIYPLCLNTVFSVDPHLAWIRTHSYPYPVFFHSSEEFGIKLKAKSEGLRMALYPQKSHYLETFTLFNQAGEVLSEPSPWHFSLDSLRIVMAAEKGDGILRGLQE